MYIRVFCQDGRHWVDFQCTHATGCVQNMKVGRTGREEISIQAEDESEGKIIDIMDALKASLQPVKKPAKRAGKRSKKTASKKAVRK